MYDGSATAKQGTTLGYFGIGFDPDPVALSGTPTDGAGFSQYRHVAFGNPRHRPSFKLTSSDLIGTRPYKWLSTTSTGTPPAGETSAGGLWILTYNAQSTNNTASYRVVMEGMIQFKGNVAPTLARVVHPPVYVVGPDGDVHPDDDEKEELVVVRKPRKG